MIKPTWSQLMFARSSRQIWKDLESKGLDSGWKQCGSLLLARSRDRFTEYRRIKAQYTYDSELIHIYIVHVIDQY